MHLTRIEWDVREYKRNCNRSLDKEKEEKLEETKGVIRSRKRSTNNTMTKKNNKKNINNDLEITTHETTDHRARTKQKIPGNVRSCCDR
jgi:FixJ family two-component response regulator